MVESYVSGIDGLIPSQYPDYEWSFNKSRFFDAAACPSDDPEPERSFDIFLPAGRHVVRTSLFKPYKHAELVLHQFVREGSEEVDTQI